MRFVSIVPIILLFLSIILGVAGQVFFKFFSISNGNKWIFLAVGLFFYGISTVFYILSLRGGVPLSVAYPSLSIGYVVVVLLASYLFAEPITSSKVAGVIMICLGVLLLFRG